ncbi:MAG: outer membrane lipoprotein carrier protein LolA [Candidatus Brocadiaceae bacterium]|nr:outer membrane lipoprotein carrier protein LolA [Candidatus Brocadiaceae bacterium]
MEESVYRNKLILSIVLISCIAFSQRNSLSDVVPAGKSLDEILTAVERANNAFKTLKADITFTRTITLLESSEVSQGEMSYKKPKRLYLKFPPPRNEINVVDGKYVWVYHPAEKQAEKYDMDRGKQSSQGLSFFEFGYGESMPAVRRDYTISLLETKDEGEKRFYILDLLPKNKKSQYSDIRLRVEEGFWLPDRIDLYESDGEVINSIELKNIKLNKGMSDKLFIFDIPRGVEVIEPMK